MPWTELRPSLRNSHFGAQIPGHRDGFCGGRVFREIVRKELLQVGTRPVGGGTATQAHGGGQVRTQSRQSPHPEESSARRNPARGHFGVRLPASGMKRASVSPVWWLVTAALADLCCRPHRSGPSVSPASCAPDDELACGSLCAVVRESGPRRGARAWMSHPR